MADGIKDVTEHLKSIEDLIPGLSNAANYLDRLKEAIVKNNRELQESATKLRELSNAYGENSVLVKVAQDSYKKLKENVGRISNVFKEVGGDLDELNAKFAKSSIGQFFGKLGESLGFSGEKSKELANTLLGPVTGGLEKNKEILAVLKEQGKDAFNPLKGSEIIKTIPVIKNLNAAMGNVLEAIYPARSAFTALGYSVMEANEKASEYITTMRQSHIRLGISRKKQIEFNKSVADIPGAIGPASESLKELTDLQGSNVMVSDIAQIAFKRFGIEASEAGQLMKKAFLDASVPVEKLPEFLGEANIAVKDIGYSQSLAVQQMIQGASTMGIFGEKASTTTGIFKEFASTLRASGVAANQVGKIYNDVVSSIAGMSTQNRAFIGMMSGMFQGASALGGALKMELAMRGPGGLEKNLEALTSSLARFGGGQILTLEQAANNPQLEMQFVLQRQMLGKLAGITNQEQQNRVLEVLQGVQRGGISRLQGSKELSEVMNKGRNLQEQSVTSLERLVNASKDSLAVLGRIDKKILNFNTAALGATKAVTGEADWSRSGIGQIGLGLSTRNQAVGRQAMQSGVGYVKKDLAITLSPSGLVGERTGDESRVSDFFKRFKGIGASPDERLPPLKNIMTPAALPETPTSAFIPKTPATFFPDIEKMLRNVSKPAITFSPDTEKMLRSVSKPAITFSPDTEKMLGSVSKPATRTALPPGIDEILGRATGETPEIAGTPTPAATVTSTESTITVKIESANPELQKQITKITRETIEKEMKKYISAERGI